VSYTDCGFGREIRLMLNRALLARSSNPVIIGVRIRPDQNSGESLLVSFHGKTNRQVRHEMLNAVIELMTRHPSQDLHFRVSYDFGPFGNVMLNMWAFSAYWLTLPARVTLQTLEAWRA